MSASCSLCSRTDREVQVLCEGRCLICSKCEQSPAIRKLMIDFLSKQKRGPNGKLSEKRYSLCPICEQSISRSMLQTFQKIEELQKATAELKISEMDYFEQESPFINFVKRFKQTYKDILSNDSTDVLDGTYLPKSSSHDEFPPLGQQNQKSVAPKGNKLNAKAEVSYQIMLPSLTPTAASEFMVDSWCFLLSGLQKSMYDSMANVAIKLYSRKKFSQRTTDIKIKTLIDFMLSDSASESAETSVIARLMGLQPRHDIVRPAMTSFCVVILILAYFPKTLGSSTLFDDSGSPSPNEFRHLLTRTRGVKKMSLSRAIKMFEYLCTSDQPHWKMSPLTAACFEYNVALPWGRESIARLLHLLIYSVMTGHQHYATGGGLSGLSGLNGLPGGAGIAQSESIVGSARQQQSGQDLPGTHSSIQSAGVTSGNAQGAHGPVGVQAGHGGHTGSGTKVAIGGPSTAAVPTGGPLPHKKTSKGDLQNMDRNGGSLAAPSYSTFAPQTSMVSDQANPSKWKVHLSIAEQFWGASVLWQTGSASSDDVFTADSFGKSPNAQLTNLDQIGVIANGSMRCVDFSTALVLLERSEDRFGSLTISAAELCLVAMAAWETEYVKLKFKLERSLVTLMRRPAISGSLQSTLSKLDKEVKLAIIRVIDWKEQGHADMEWEAIKRLGAAKALPFHFPKAILQRSAAELDHIARAISETRLKMQEIETYQDLVTLNEPYGTVTRKKLQLDALPLHLQPLYTETDELKIYAAGASEGVHLSRDEMAILRRKEYLSSQVLGDGRMHSGRERSDRGLSGPAAVAGDGDGDGGGGGGGGGGGSEASSSARVHRSPRPSRNRAIVGVLEGDGDTNVIHENRATRRGSDSAAQSDEYLEAPHGGPDGPGGRPTQLHDIPEYNGMYPGSGLEAAEYNVGGFRVDHLTPVGHFSRPGSASHGPALASLAYKSPRPHPANYRVSMVDIIEVKSPAVLARVNLVAKNPTEIDLDQLLTLPKGLALPAGMPPSDMTLSEGSSFMDENMNGSIVSSLPSREMIAKARVVSRIGSAVYDASLSVQGSQVNLERDAKTSANKADKYASSVHLGGVDSNDSIFDGVAPLTQVAVQAISFKDADFSQVTVDHVIERYLNIWQLEVLRKVDMTECKLGDGALQSLCRCFSKRCNLIHLCLGNMRMGEIKCKQILEAMYAGGVHKTLLRLELDRNNFTFATDKLMIISKFTRLRALDLSHNSITVDLARQRETLKSLLSPLTQLQSLSLAYNRIQDNGLETVLELCKGMPQLAMLDLANCFITNRSCGVLQDMILWTQPKLEEFLMQNNLILQAEVGELKFIAYNAGVKVYFEGGYSGIARPLRYDVQEEEQMWVAEKKRLRELEQIALLERRMMKRKNIKGQKEEVVASALVASSSGKDNVASPK